MLQKNLFSSFKDGPLCSPEGRDCIESSSEETFGCQVPCQGLYADVSKIEVPENSKYSRIVEEYLNFKRNYVNNVRFNASANSTFFSEYIWKTWSFYLKLSSLRWRSIKFISRACPHLLWHGLLWRDSGRQKDQVRGSTQPDWRNHGTSHWILDHQWCWNSILCH